MLDQRYHYIGGYIMRTLLFILAALFVVSAAPAQVSVHINIGNQPVWGPVGYDYAEYYYFPDVEMYYYVPAHRYYYFDRGRWVGVTTLPPRYRGFDVYHSYKVVINDPAPYRHHAKYRDAYAEFKGRHDQEIIRDSHDERYYVIKNHPNHGNWVKEHGKHGNGRGNGKRGKGVSD
jgi:hypothetical protein